MSKYTFHILILLHIATFLTACSSREASHLPTLIQLPGAVISSTIENTFYNAKRNKVEAYVAQHYLAIRHDVYLNGGPALEGAFDTINIKGSQRDIAMNLFIAGSDYLFKNSQLVADHLSEVFFALYGVKRIDKKSNGLSRMEVYQIIMDNADENFESLRLAVQQGQGAGLDKLATHLNINSPSKRPLFNQQASLLYKLIYLEPVVVGLMVHN